MVDYRKQQENEISTVKTRIVTLDLSDADVERIFQKAGSEGLTVSELLQNFIGDLVYGTYRNGSDEHDYAQQWLERCCFGGHEKKNFSQSLIEWDQLDEVAQLWSDMQQAKEELAEAIERPDLYDAEDLEIFKEEIDFCTQEINGLYSAYRRTKCEMPEAEMKTVLLWHQCKMNWCNQKNVESAPLIPSESAKGSLQEKLEWARRECGAAKQEGHTHRQIHAAPERD